MQLELLKSVLFAFLGNSLIAVGQGTQKSQVSKFSKDETGKEKAKRIFVWIIGIVCSNLGLVFIYIAIGKGFTTIVGALNSSGIFVLLLFSHFVLKEKINRFEIAGIGLIFAGIVLISLFPLNIVPKYDFSLSTLWLTIIAIVAVVVAILVVLKIKHKATGTFLAVLAGIFTGTSQIFQKVHRLPHILESLPKTLGFLQSYAWLPFLAASFLILQFSYRKNRVITVVPIFNSLTVIIPIVFGQVFFGERLSALQWVGVGLIIAGVAVIDIWSRRQFRELDLS